MEDINKMSSEEYNKRLHKEIDRIARFTVSRYSHQQKEDLYQECWLEALTIHQTFEGDINEFCSYIAKRLKGLCINLTDGNRGNNRVNNNIENESLDEIIYTGSEYSMSKADILESYIDLEKQIEDRDRIRHLLHSISNQRDLQILHLYLEGYNSREIESEYPRFNLNKRQIQNIINKYKNDNIQLN